MILAECYSASHSFIPYTGFNFLADYADNHDIFDDYYLFLKYQDKTVLPIAERKESRDKIIKAILLKNSYKYNNLLRTTKQEYNPIENYDRMEEGTETDTRTRTGTESTSGSSSLTKGGTITIETVQEGKQTDKQTNNTTQTNAYDKTKTTIENGVKAFNDSTNYVDDSKSVTDSIAHDDTITNTGTIENERSFTNRKDTTTDTLNTTDTGSNSETLTLNTTDTNTHSFQNRRVHGNIGITTNAQLLSGERELSMFSFLDIVFADIVAEITTGVW